LLVTRQEFLADLDANYAEMQKFGISRKDAPYFLPPFEWYNSSISGWTKEAGLQLINFSPGTISHADYTTPDMPNYRGNDEIYQSIISFEKKKGLNGFILLVHIGADPKRTDKFYSRLDELLTHLKKQGYRFVKVNELLEKS